MEQGSDYEYDVVLSFAGEDRDYVESVVKELDRQGVSAFYDQNEQSILWGKDLQPYFDKVYRVLARYCMVFISKHYSNKTWTRMELKFAKKRASQDEMKEYILPIRLDDTTISEIPDTIGYMKGATPPKDVAEIFVQKLNHDISAKNRSSGFTRTTLKKRIFLSFDYPSDNRLKDFIINQSKNNDSPFELLGCSIEQVTPQQNCKQVAEDQIKKADWVIVMVGPQTHSASGVLKEVEMARRNNIPIVQVIGYKDGNYAAVPNAGRLYRWNWDDLKKLLA